MPDLIQVADDLKNMPDQWLAQQMQSPNGSVPPWLVASEVQRRQKLRSGAAQAQAPQSSVSQDLIRSLFSKIPPTAGLMPPGQQGQAPPGMPPVNLTPGGGSGALGSPPPGTPPANLRMPARTMAFGGSVDDEEDPYADPPVNRGVQTTNELRREQDLGPADQTPPLQSRLLAEEPAPLPRRSAASGDDPNKVLAEVNALRRTMDLPPLSELPPDFQSRLLAGRPDSPEPFPPEPAAKVAAVTGPTNQGVQAVNTMRQGQGLGPADQTPPLQSRLLADDNIAKLVQAASQKYAIAPEIITAVMRAESNGRANARSPKDARGLMQIIPSTAADLGVKDPALLDDPAVNIDTGTHYLRQQLDKYKDLSTALAAYQAGPGTVDKYGGIPPFRETGTYINKIVTEVNAARKSYGLGPIEQLPANLQSRLLRPMPAAPASANPAPGVAAMLPAQVAQQPQATTDMVDPAAAPAPAPDTAAEASAPPAAAAPPGSIASKPAPLQQEWNPPEPSELTDARRAAADFEKTHVPLDQRLRDLYGKDNINLLNQGAKELIGPPQDYSKYQKAIDNVMQIAHQQMHPSIGQALMSFGLALMANKSHNFGVALGEAGSYAMSSMQALKQQGMKDYLEAAKAGINLQDKMDQYNAKIGQYKMQRLGAQQTGAIQDDRTWQTRLAGLQKEVRTAQSAFDKANATPAAVNIKLVAIANRDGIRLDPNIEPIKQFAKMGLFDRIQEAGGKTATAPKAPPIPEQQMDSAVRQTLLQAGRPQPPANRLATMQDVPLELHPQVSKLFGDIAAQKTIQTQAGVADAATKDLDPTFIGAAIAQTGSLPPGFGRSPLTVAKMWNMGTQWLKANGYTALSAVAARNAAQANKGALNGLTKTTANVEAFSKLAEANMKTLEGLAAKVRDLGAPVYNTPARDLAKMWGGDARVSDMQVALATVRAEVARVLNSASANGQITIPAKDEMEKLLGDNYTYSMLVSALNVFRAEMANRRNVYKAELEDLTQMSVVGGEKKETRVYNGHTYIKQDGEWKLQP